jgi:ABC-2 type transport system ATP-binding protein
MADRVGVISKGELIVVEEKTTLMKKLGKRQLTLHLQEHMAEIPSAFSGWPLELNGDGTELIYTFDAQKSENISQFLRKLTELGIGFKDLNTRESSLEDIFVSLVSTRT